MPLYLIFFTSFLIGLSGAVSPGPLLAVTVEETLKKDYKAGPVIIIGHALLELLLVIFLIIGFGNYLKKELIQKYISIFGGIFLIYFGYTSLISARKEINYSSQKIQVKNKVLILKGIIVSLSNPYWTIWWVTIGLTYLSIAFPHGFWGIFLFFTGHILSDFLWYSLVSYTVDKGKMKFQKNFVKGLSYFFSVFLISFGLFLLYRII